MPTRKSRYTASHQAYGLADHETADLDSICEIASAWYMFVQSVSSLHSALLETAHCACVKICTPGMQCVLAVS